MNLVNVASLADALREERITEAEKYRYLLLSLILSYIFGRGGFFSTRLTYGHLIYFVLSLTVSIIGLHWCYRTNAARDNREFIPRFICLGVPIMLWTSVAYGLLYYAIYALVVSTQGLAAAKILFKGTNPVQMVLGLIVLVIYFWLLRKFVARAASSS